MHKQYNGIFYIDYQLVVKISVAKSKSENKCRKILVT